jgi:hypothetical protein
VQFPIKVGECEIRRLQRSKRITMSACRLAKKPYLVRVIMNYRLALMAGKSREIKLLAIRTDELRFASDRNWDTHVTQARALWLQLPTSCTMQLCEGQPQIVTVSTRIGR